uniref:Thiolase_N domain-containing protein n=1 Tax=Caenorhabditis japonica TaxID=281687 RepID=A0A8R1EGU5_CAEJA
MVLHFNLSSLTDNVTLDSVNLHSFRNISLICSSDLSEPALKSIRILRETVEFKFEKALFPGQYLLTIGEYNGRIGNGSEGLFERRDPMLYTTHLQPNNARRLFPCLDDPAVKSLFRLSVVHPTDTVAQSNTIAMDVHVESRKWQRTIFQATPILPAYLVAFSVMPDSHLQAVLQSRIVDVHEELRNGHVM